MAQRLDPDGDISTGLWILTPLWSKLNDGDNPNDGNSVNSTSLLTTTTFEVSLTNPALTPSPGDTTITVRLKSTRTDGSCTLELYEGTTQRGLSTVTPTASFVDYSFVVSSGIGDFTNLRVRVTKEASDLVETQTVSHIKVVVPGVTVQQLLSGKGNVRATTARTMTGKSRTTGTTSKTIGGASTITYDAGGGFKNGTTFDFEPFRDSGVAWIDIANVQTDDSTYASVNLGDF